MPGVEADHYEQGALWGAGQDALPDHDRQRADAVDALLPPVDSVLDVGAGDGRVLHRLLERRPGLVAVAAERSATALGHVRAGRVQCSGEALPFADASVDAVLSCEVLEHLPPDVYDAVRVELGRVARHAVLISVPNQERRRAADVTCPACGCRYHRERHLRSFHPRDLPDLLPGCELVAWREAGPHQPVYPRVARLALERAGLLEVLGSPSCPQCGTAWTGGRPPTTPSPATPTTPTDGPDGGGGRASGAYRRIRGLAPKARHPYWLLALYRPAG